MEYLEHNDALTSDAHADFSETELRLNFLRSELQ